MRRLPRQILLVALCGLVLAPAAGAKPLLAVVGDMGRMQSQTGQHSDGQMRFIGWGFGLTWGNRFENLFQPMGDVPVLSLNTSSRSGREAITPRGIARGQGDRYLLAFNRAINRAINELGRPVIIRPLAEMNGHWNSYSAYNRDGSRRNAAHSQKNFRRAFKRIYLILHGGDRVTINAKLAHSGMPGIRTSPRENPHPTLKVLWNPQGYGSPNVPGNRAHVYYPGDAYVDMVGNDLFESASFTAAWEANLALYRRYSHKPYAIGEFGLYWVDRPGFIRKMGQFIRTHSRVELAVFLRAERGNQHDLGTKPKSRAAYRRYITPLNQ